MLLITSGLLPTESASACSVPPPFPDTSIGKSQGVLGWHLPSDGICPVTASLPPMTPRCYPFSVLLSDYSS